MSTSGVSIGIAVSSAGGCSGGDGGGGGIGDSCRLTDVVTFIGIDLERAVSFGHGSTRSLSISSTNRNRENNY